MKKTSLVLRLISGGAIALFLGCAGDGGETTPTTGGSTTPTGGSTTTPTGGSTTTPGGTAACSTTSNSVSFTSNQATGAMCGYGWVALASKASLSQPNCGGTPITSAAPCLTTTTWNSPTALCITGTIPALPATPVQADYDSNWGIQIGVNAKEPNDSIGRTINSVNISISGTPSSGLRLMLHKKGDPDAKTYCAPYAGSAVPITSFNTACWDGTGTSLTAADTTSIDKFGVQVSSTASAITITNLCLNGITFT